MLTVSLSLHVTEPSVNAMFDATDGESSTGRPRVPEAPPSSRSAQHLSSPSAGEPPNVNGNATDCESTIVRNLLSPSRDHYSSPHSAPLEHSLELEQILTEDGEPMLNPGLFLVAFLLSSS